MHGFEIQNEIAINEAYHRA